MILTDAGPLIALLNRNDPNHSVCLATAKILPAGTMLTTWPCFTEAMYLLYRAGGLPAQMALWTMCEAGRLQIHNASAAEMARMAALMKQYHDLPMDLADASLVAAAEALGFHRVFTLDRDFFVYRFADGSAVDVVRLETA